MFRDPVDPVEVPDYLDLIKKPMDFSTMRKKVADFKYDSFGECEIVITKLMLLENLPTGSLLRNISSCLFILKC